MQKRSYANLALVAGIMLVALGAWVIYSAYESHYRWTTGLEGYYRAWETGPLLFGTALALVGTALTSASATYRLVTRKK